MSTEEAADCGIIKKQTSGEQAWNTFLTVLLEARNQTRLRVPETLLFGWAAKKPTLLYTDDSGYLRKSKDVAASFIANFLTFCPKEDVFPVCVGRQLSSFVILEPKVAMSLWHKSLVTQKPLFLQHFVAQGGLCSTLVRIIWKPDSMLFVTLTNSTPYSGFLKRRSVFSLGKLIPDPEDRFFTRANQASMSAAISNKEELEVFTEVLANLYRKHFNEQHQFLSELVAEFVQDKKGSWFLLRVPAFEMTRNLQSNMPLLTPIRLKNRNWLHIDRSQYKNLSIRQMSQTILSIKQSLGLAITTDDRERLASYTDFSKKLKPRSSLPQVKSRKPKAEEKPAPYLLLEPVSKSLSSLDMPPLFEFPTPRENEDLNRSVARPKMEEIKEHILRQNNSMFMRIHYQEELSEERRKKQHAKQSVSYGAREFDRLREKGMEGRVILRSHQDEIYRGFSIA